MTGVLEISMEIKLSLTLMIGARLTPGLARSREGSAAVSKGLRVGDCVLTDHLLDQELKALRGLGGFIGKPALKNVPFERVRRHVLEPERIDLAHSRQTPPYGGHLQALQSHRVAFREQHARLFQPGVERFESH